MVNSKLILIYLCNYQVIMPDLIFFRVNGK